MFWARIRNFYMWTGGVCLINYAGGTDYTQDTIEFSESSGDTPICSSYVGGVGSSVASSAILTNIWHHYCMVRTSTTALTFYVDGSSIGTVTTNVSGRAAPSIMVVNTWFTPDGAVNADSTLDGDFCSLKMWTTALSVGEVVVEKQNIYPVKTSSLHGAWYMNTNYLDYSNTGKVLSLTGTIEYSDNPTIRTRRTVSISA
jgi:hypothetical protein